MNPAEDDPLFLRDLVKAARQRTHHVKWTDRDGTARLSALTASENVRLNHLAQRQKLSPAELLRQAAHIPVAKQ